MKFSKIYITLAAVVLCMPIYIAYFAITGHLPSFISGGFPDTSYIPALRNSLINASLCAAVSTILGCVLALFFSKIRDRFSVFFTKGSNYEVYIFNIIVFSILWLIIYLNGYTAGFVTLGHCMICVPLVFCMIYGFSGDMVLMSRCAAEIGSSPVQTFFKITMPMILPSVIAGFIASLTISFNDIIIVHLISRGTAQCFTLKILSYLREGHDVGVVCISMFACTLIAALVSASLCIKTNKSSV